MSIPQIVVEFRCGYIIIIIIIRMCMHGVIHMEHVEPESHPTRIASQCVERRDSSSGHTRDIALLLPDALSWILSEMQSVYSTLTRIQSACGSCRRSDLYANANRLTT